MLLIRRRPFKVGTSVWLVTWDWVGDYAKPDHKIVAVFNLRWSPSMVREYVEFLYANSEYSPSERISYSQKRFNPYPAEFSRVRGVAFSGVIKCGHNPWLYARIVDNLHIVEEPDGTERLAWSDRPVPNFEKIISDFNLDETNQTVLSDAVRGSRYFVRKKG